MFGCSSLKYYESKRYLCRTKKTITNKIKHKAIAFQTSTWGFIADGNFEMSLSGFIQSWRSQEGILRVV